MVSHGAPTLLHGSALGTLLHPVSADESYCLAMDAAVTWYWKVAWEQHGLVF